MMPDLKRLLAGPLWQLLSQSPDLSHGVGLLWGGEEGEGWMAGNRCASSPWPRRRLEPGCGRTRLYVFKIVVLVLSLVRLRADSDTSLFSEGQQLLPTLPQGP